MILEFQIKPCKEQTELKEESLNIGELSLFPMF